MKKKKKDNQLRTTQRDLPLALERVRRPHRLSESTSGESERTRQIRRYEPKRVSLARGALTLTSGNLRNHRDRNYNPHFYPTTHKSRAAISSLQPWPLLHSRIHQARQDKPVQLHVNLLPPCQHKVPFLRLVLKLLLVRLHQYRVPIDP